MQTNDFPFDALLGDRVLSYIRAGGYPLIAAEAAGVPSEVFLQWIAWGENQSAGEPYAGFARGVRQAAAQGRLVAELAVHEKDPKYWLAHGPGKETGNNPGWTAEARPSGAVESLGEAASTVDQWQTLYALLMNALADHPEARLAVAEALRKLPSNEHT
jgi:hypothetical protein